MNKIPSRVRIAMQRMEKITLAFHQPEEAPAEVADVKPAPVNEIRTVVAEKAAKKQPVKKAAKK